MTLVVVGSYGGKVSYYQKYRPKKIEELDLASVRESLLGVMKTGKMAHAYLLLGPRGAGKTSTARILAKVMNCEKNVEGKQWQEACNECDSCRLIESGSAIDILEMDAASHRGIDDMRELKEKVNLAPVQLRKKIYIIDEVHMLTTEAFNALLKTLEEPPADVVFFLCTTEGRKVPETIVSRCTKIGFTKATPEEIKRSLLKVVEGEGLKVKEEALQLLSESVDGSFREAHKILEQLSVEEEIGLKEVELTLGLVGRLVVKKLLEAMEEGRTEEIGGLLDEEEKKGVAAETLVKEILLDLRRMIRDGVGNRKEEVMMMEELIVASEKIKISPLPFLPIELALMKAKILSGDGGGGDGGKESDSEKKASREKEVKKFDGVEESKVGEREEAGEDRVAVANNQSPLNKSDLVVDFGQIESQWGQLLEKITPKNQSIAGLLRSVRPKEIDGDNLMLEVFYKFHKEQLELDARKRIIEEEMQSMWGPVRLKCILGEKAMNAPQTADEVMAEDKKKEEILNQAAEEIFG